MTLLTALVPGAQEHLLRRVITVVREFHYVNDSQLSDFILEATGAQPASHASVSCVRDVSDTEISCATVFVCVGAGVFSICALFFSSLYASPQPL